MMSESGPREDSGVEAQVTPIAPASPERQAAMSQAAERVTAAQSQELEQLAVERAGDIRMQEIAGLNATPNVKAKAVGLFKLMHTVVTRVDDTARRRRDKHGEQAMVWNARRADFEARAQGQEKHLAESKAITQIKEERRVAKAELEAETGIRVKSVEVTMPRVDFIARAKRGLDRKIAEFAERKAVRRTESQRKYAEYSEVLTTFARKIMERLTPEALEPMQTRVVDTEGAAAPAIAEISD